MKRVLCLLCLLCILFSACGKNENVITSTSDSNASVQTGAAPDGGQIATTTEPKEKLPLSPELEAAARSAMGGYVYDLTPELLSSIVTLRVVGFGDERYGAGALGETAFEGIEYFTALRGLEITAYTGPTLDFVRHLPSLKVLLVRGPEVLSRATPVVDISALTGLAHLEELELTNLHLNTLVPIGTLERLQVLWLRNFYTTDLNPLVTLQELRELSVATDFNFMAQSTITDISALARLPKLEFLRLCGFSGDLSPIRYLPLTALGLVLCDVPDYSVIPPTVRAFYAEKSNFSDGDMKYVEQLKDLESLQLYNQPIQYEGALRELTIRGIHVHYPDFFAPGYVSDTMGKLWDPWMDYSAEKIQQEYVKEKNPF